MDKSMIRSSRFLCSLACFFGLVASGSAMATAHLDVAAGAVQINSYGGITPVLFYTGSVCSTGHLTLDPSADVDTQKLLWATVLSAKATGGKLGFDYDFNADNCVIRAFSVAPN